MTNAIIKRVAQACGAGCAFCGLLEATTSVRVMPTSRCDGVGECSSPVRASCPSSGDSSRKRVILFAVGGLSPACVFEQLSAAPVGEAQSCRSRASTNHCGHL